MRSSGSITPRKSACRKSFKMGAFTNRYQGPKCPFLIRVHLLLGVFAGDGEVVAVEEFVVVGCGVGATEAASQRVGASR
jgi:hypothetical protein